MEHLENEVDSITRLGKVKRYKPRLMMVRFRTKRAATIVCEKSPKLAHDRLLWQVYINPDLSLEERQRNFLKRQNKRNKASDGMSLHQPG